MISASADVAVDPDRRVVRVRSASLGRGAAQHADRVRFLARVMACGSVERVDLDCWSATATIHLRADGTPFRESVAALASAVRGEHRSEVALPRDCLDHDRISLQRLGNHLTTWQVGSEGPRRLRFRHPRMRRDRVLSRGVERLVASMPGVHRARLTGWSCDLVVDFDDARLEADTLLTVLQHAVEMRAGCQTGFSPLHMAGTSVTLGVAALADFVFPVLAPLSAVLLVGTNVRTITASVNDLRRRRVGVATITTAIVAGTLISGQFLASGIMAWSFAFWKRRHRRDIEAERRLLLEDAAPLPVCSLIDRTDGTLAVQPVETLASGDHLRLGPWDIVPADVAILEGRGVIDERCATGVAGVRTVGPDDRVQAGAVVLGGRLVAAVGDGGQEPRVARAAQLLAAATQIQPGRFAPTRHADEFVDHFAGPTLATAGIGLLAGDVNTAVAVMRPDYASAEAMAVSFEDIDAVACGLAAGCVVTVPQAFNALASVDTILLVDHPALHQRRLEVTRVSGVDPDSDAGRETLRWAASLARHLADPRREALTALAAARGAILTDIIPDAWGDDTGLRMTHRRSDRTLSLVEDAAVNGTRTLVLQVNGTARATFEFGPGLARRASLAVDRMRDVRPLRLVLAQAAADPSDTLAAELHCDTSVRLGGDPAGSLSDVVSRLCCEGRSVAVVGPAALTRAVRDVAALTVALGFEPDTQGQDADIYSMAGDIACLSDLLAGAARRRSRLALSRKLSILPNIAVVMGAFLFGFTSLVGAVVSNMGTLGIYRRASSAVSRDRRTHWLRQGIAAASGRRRLASPRHPAGAP